MPTSAAAPAVSCPDPLYRGYRFPPEVISHAVWLSYRFALSHRDVEEVLAERGGPVSYEAVRLWCRKFGATFAAGPSGAAPDPEGVEASAAAALSTGAAAHAGQRPCGCRSRRGIRRLVRRGGAGRRARAAVAIGSGMTVLDLGSGAGGGSQLRLATIVSRI
jgi:hypothetical protein